MRLTKSQGDVLELSQAPIEDRFAGDEPKPAEDHVPRRLGDVLVGRAVVTGEQLGEALVAQTATGRRLGEVMVELGLLSQTDLAEALAEQLGLLSIALARTELDTDITALLPEGTARELCAIPVQRDGDRVVVAVGDPLRPDLSSRLIAALEAPVRLVVAARNEVEHAIEQSYLNESEFTDAFRDFEARQDSRRRPETTQRLVTVDENAPVVRVVTLVLERAVRDRASDVHIEPQEDHVRVRVRTDGALHEIMSLPHSLGTPLVSRIKIMADMNIVEKRRAQDGQMTVEVLGRELDVRVSTTSTVFGEKCVLRLLDKTRAFLDLPGLGMADDTATVYRSLIRSPYGMVICAGPTGSGKTTTLYATLAAINNDEINIMTIEDPVEYIVANINQIQINAQAGTTFANGLRSILRQDPDSILVGEIRDVETARIAVQAALTGHFVMSSLHATDATSALHRFMDMGIEPFLIASSLLGVVGQRLVRKICTHCKEPYVLTLEERAFYEESGGNPDKTAFVHGAGCNFCGQTGYFERVGIYEVLRISDRLKELIVTNASLAELRDVAVAEGMRTLRDQAIRFVENDGTTVAEVLRTVYYN